MVRCAPDIAVIMQMPIVPCDWLIYDRKSQATKARIACHAHSIRCTLLNGLCLFVLHHNECDELSGKVSTMEAHSCTGIAG